MFVFSLLLSNVMSLVPKICELREIISNSDVDIELVSPRFGSEIILMIILSICQVTGWFGLTELMPNTGDLYVREEYYSM